MSFILNVNGTLAGLWCRFFFEGFKGKKEEDINLYICFLNIT